jgi:hypothetical protein
MEETRIKSKQTMFAITSSDSPQKVEDKQLQLANLALNDLDAEEVGKIVAALQEEIKIIKL